MKRALQKTALGLLAGLLIGIPPVMANDPTTVKSLRQNSVSSVEQETTHYRQEIDVGATLPRDFVQQPPLVPHASSNYQVTMKFNKCLDCHSWGRAQATNSPKISVTHFRDAQGRELSSVSPGRYFCMQCHVTQSDAKPLVENTFQRVPGLN
ncbi:nitrate reductase cytochrome c-type subunit [Bordetella sp. BOR01]|uniref:nitrate reductase cytochrome c-type subunit n=1 Tax=Bordetella sp. BOR01 TaxID=2854779 RepID=UPI001C491C36|nr:nitrate reductase cytochrome c-type subunit [Bordetella sp. BOR01]MBV7483581.1 nitrate reductase cytochrome c-type subunit [Bordetella sp. BOR01]